MNKKIAKYEKNSLLKNIIKKYKNIQNSSKIQNNSKIPIKLIEKTVLIRNKNNSKFTLQPFIGIEENINPGEEIKLIQNQTHNKGGFSNVYVTDKNLIFKLITDNKNNSEFKSLIFHKLLLEIYKNDERKEYLCNLIEFGDIKDKEYKYAIMENCGTSLFKYLKSKNKQEINFDNLFDIFYQCCVSLSLIHDLKYLHLDIKLENFLLNNNGQIKIIDFGMVNKNEFETNGFFGTMEYLPCEFLLKDNSNEEKKLTYSHDIFGLGCLFIELLYKLILDKKILMACPLIIEKKNSNNTINNFFTYIKDSNTWGSNNFINFFKKKYYNNQIFKKKLFRKLKEDYIYYKRIDFIVNTEENNKKEQKIEKTKIIYKEYNEMILTIENDLKTHFEKNISTISNDLKKEKKKIFRRSKNKISSLQKEIDDINTNIKLSIFLIKRMCYPDPEIRCNNIHEIINHIDNLKLSKNATKKLNYNSYII